MKKIIMSLVLSTGALFPTFALADIPPFPQQQCSNSYWLDTANKTCESPREFCGAYAYEGLQTFSSKQDCLNSANHRTSYDFGNVTLRNGSRGAAVMELQRYLNQTLNLGLAVDGVLGPKTIAVIKQWQGNNGLAQDGLVGVKTKAKMNASIQ